MDAPGLLEMIVVLAVLAVTIDRSSQRSCGDVGGWVAMVSAWIADRSSWTVFVDTRQLFKVGLPQMQSSPLSR
jgi:hypothetical protein